MPTLQHLFIFALCCSGFFGMGLVCYILSGPVSEAEGRLILAKQRYKERWARGKRPLQTFFRKFGEDWWT